MVDEERVSRGEDLTITPEEIVDSEWGSLLAVRQQIFPTERRNTMISTWIKQAKLDFINLTSRTWAYFIADSDRKIRAHETIIMIVGIKILRRAQNARISYTDADYSRQIKDLQKEIDGRILNFCDPVSPVNIGNVESDNVDPDSDYDYNQ